MYDVLEGIRIVEVAHWAFVPSAAAVLADWGADVVKIVHPERPDPLKTLVAAGLDPLPDGTSYMWEFANRGKRSLGVDLGNPEGRALLDDLLRGADVFVTSFLPDVRARLGLEVDDVRRVNPGIVYARGSAAGPHGPEAGQGGFDSVTFWARAGITDTLSRVAGQFMPSPGPGAGDFPAGFCLASGIVAALLKRERTGEGSVVDASLLGAGVWQFGGSIAASELYERDHVAPRPHGEQRNALATGYATKDGRYIIFGGFASDRYWDDLCRQLGCPELADDPRFASHDARDRNNVELIRAFDSVFASRTLAEWRPRLVGLPCPWSVLQTAREVLSDPQVVANGYLPLVEARSGRKVRVAAAPVQFDEHVAELVGAPEPAEQTEEILLELGRDWDTIGGLKERGVIS